VGGKKGKSPGEKKRFLLKGGARGTQTVKRNAGRKALGNQGDRVLRGTINSGVNFTRIRTQRGTRIKPAFNKRKA